MKRDAIDLSTVNVYLLFSRYFFPALLGMVSVASVVVMDGVFVGRGVGSDGIAAINLLLPVFMLFTGVGLMVGVGASVVASIHLSRGKSKAARINVSQALIFVTIAALIPSILMLAFPQGTARLMGASEHLVPYVVDYLVWYVPSWVFQIWITSMLFVIRLDGAPKFAMMTSVVSAIVNLVLDWLFIIKFGWGVMGAGFSTSLSTVAGGLMAILYVLFYARHLRYYRLKMSLKSFRLSLRNIGYQCRIGSSGLLGEVTMAVFMFVGNQVFMKYLGDDGVGAFGIACYYAPFVFMAGNSISQSAQPIISYNYGAGLLRRASLTQRVAIGASVICGLLFTGIFFFLPYPLVELFLRPDSAAAQMAIFGLPWFSLGFIFFLINLSCVGYFQSLEKVVPAMAFALLRGFIFLVPCFLLLPQVWGVAGIWLAMPVSELLTTLLILAYFMVSGRK